MTTKELNFSIKKDDIKNILNNVITSYNLVNNDIYDEEAFLEIVKMAMITYSAYAVKPAFKDNIMEYIKQLREVVETNLMERITETCEELNDEEYNEIVKTLDFLDTVPQPAQRTPEWYAFRADKVTASDFSVAHDKNPYSSKLDFILKKSGMETPFVSNSAIQHGVKYEDVAIYMYELRNNVTVKEYGCIPHKKYSFVGASPDGICSKNSENKKYVGRMLEIKCPKSRKLNGYVPEYYFYQVQGQLEVCELELCDFLECKITEYSGEEEFSVDTNKSRNQLYQENGREKGVVIELYNNTKKGLEYRYFNLDEKRDYYTMKDVKEWEEKIIDESLNDDNLDYTRTSFWKLDEYSVILVRRDREFWDKLIVSMEELWNQVLLCRRMGCDAFIEKYNNEQKLKPNYKEKKPRGKKSNYFGKEYEVALLPDSDDETLPHNIKNCEETNKNKGSLEVFNI